MKNLALRKFHLLVTSVSVYSHLRIDSGGSDYNFFAQNVSHLHSLSHLSPPAPSTTNGVETAGISDY